MMNRYTNSIMTLLRVQLLIAVVGIPNVYGATDKHIKPFPDAVPLTVCDSFPASIWGIDLKAENRARFADDLFNNIQRLHRMENCYASLLSEASCWHMLFRTGIDSAMGRSEQILHRLSKTAPERPEIAWISGMNLLWAGNINKGLRRLYTIRTSEFSDNDDLTRDYLRLCASCLLPSEWSLFSETVYFQDPTSLGWDIFGRVEETFPETVVLKEFSERKHDSLPSIMLSAAFEMTPNRSLDVAWYKSEDCRLNMSIDSSIACNIPQEPVSDWFSERSKMEIHIVALPGMWFIPAEEQIVSMITGQFDYVRKVNDLKRFGAVGVRCGKRSVFRNVAGAYYAFVGFDARVCGNKGKTIIRPVYDRPLKESIPVRYLITLKSCDDITFKAERILQNVLSCFNTGS